MTCCHSPPTRRGEPGNWLQASPPTRGWPVGPESDLARRAENALGTPAFAALAASSGISGQELTRQALAWRYGAAAGLEVLRAEWDPGAETAGTAELMKAARTALA